MIQISQVKIPVFQADNDSIETEVAKILHIRKTDLQNFKIMKRSMDARHKPELFYVYQLRVEVLNEKKILKNCSKNKNVKRYEKPYDLKKNMKKVSKKESVYIIGAGPAGLFAAYYLALAGARPIVIEQGQTVDERKKTIEKFWETGILSSTTNVSFGEGGAGTFSDGKLNTGVKDRFGRIRFVLETFVECGADPAILYEAKPHIGTDDLQRVIPNLRHRIEEQGGSFYFEHKMTDFESQAGEITRLQIQNLKTREEEWVPCKKCILAIGHSARDTFFMLQKNQVEMEPKSFAVGVRVEHLQKEINEVQYGMNDSRLPSADYKCSATGVNERGVYSFCMCPGGFVVNASTEDKGLVVNGMSNHGRDEKNSNSAIIVTVTPDDFGDSSALAGISFQRELEKKCFEIGKGKIPVQRFGDFKKNIPSKSFGRVTPNTKGGTMLSNVRSIFPDEISQSLIVGMEQFGKRMKGFDDEDTLLEGVETRTSSPVRIVRGESLTGKLEGLYPCGEGAGYAGGIMSAAMDGLKVAEKIVDTMNQNGE